jgi:hypothetical protein
MRSSSAPRIMTPPSEAAPFMPFFRTVKMEREMSQAPEPRPVSELGAGLVACGERLATLGVSAALTGGSSFAQALKSFEAPGGLIGTGVHVGGGHVLTARHVADSWRPPSMWRRGRASSRRERFDAFAPGWSVCFVPAPGSFAGGPHAPLKEEHSGRFNDWILLHGLELSRAPSLLLKRGSAHVSGEPVWLVGDHTGSSFRVTCATFDRVEGVNAWLSGCEVDTGFAGSPVIDSAGRVIGIAVRMMPNGRCLLVRSDTILHRLARARRFDQALPRLGAE